jgi:ribonucleoside-diphosphate reductase alpha chain
VFDRSWYEENLSGVIPVTAPDIDISNYEFYRSAYEVDQKSAVEMNGLRAKKIDQGTSFNIYVKPSDISDVKQLAELYRLAWMTGQKSVYYVRSNAPEQDKLEVLDRSMECSGCQ